MSMRTIEEVGALASGKSALASAKKLAKADAWRRLGRDGAALWGVAVGSKGDHYAVYVQAGGAEALRCSCPSRQRPCKHALALALLEAGGHEFDEQPLPTGHRYG
jgi:uncharacterized Zn finger protein